MRVLRVLTVVCLLAALVGITGCETIARKATDAAIEKTTGVKVDTQGESVTIQGEDGSNVTVAGGKVPDGFPKDVPVIDGEIEATWESGDGMFISLKTKMSMDDAADWYEKELTSEGWKQETTYSTADSRLYVAKKGERMVQIAVGQQEGVANVTVTVTQPE